MLAARDPDVLAAVDGVDRTLIVSALARDPWERVRESAANARFVMELRRCQPERAMSEVSASQPTPRPTSGSRCAGAPSA